MSNSIYAHAFVNGRRVPVHVLRAEVALGKPLPKGAIVHHADGSVKPDAPLVICQDQKYHKLLHIRMNVLRAGGNPNTDRICWKCKQVKPMTAFYRTRVKAQTSEGIMKECKACDNDRNMLRRRKQRRVVGVPERVNHHARRELVA